MKHKKRRSCVCQIFNQDVFGSFACKN